MSRGRFSLTRWLLVLAWGGAPAALWANGMRLVSQDGFATARGEAFAATADNPSAIYYNPAGITQLDGQNLRGGLYGLYLDPSFNPPAKAPNHGQTYHSDMHYAGVPQLFYTYRPQGGPPATLGLGIYSPYGASIDWPQNTGFRSVATRAALTYLRVNPVLALKLGDHLSLGAGVFADYAKIDLQQGLRPLAAPLLNYFGFNGDGFSVGYNAGILWQPLEQLSFGATFRSPSRFRMEGHTSIEQQPVIAARQLPAQADFTFPLTAVLGVSYRPSPKWNLEVDADYTDWSSLGTVVIHQLATPPFPVQKNVSVTLDWQHSWMYEFGATRYFENGWQVSAGYVFNGNSVPNTRYTPLAADLDRHFVTLGTGFRGRRYDFDIAYQFGYGPGQSVAGSTPSSTPGLFAGQTANGTYHFISHAVMISVGWHF